MKIINKLRQIPNYSVICELFVIGAVILLLYRCPFLAITGIECPGCHLTRAFKAALRLDFAEAFSQHPLFGLVGLGILYLLFRKYRKLPTWIEITYYSITLILMFVLWIYRVSH